MKKKARPTGRRCGAALEEVRAVKPQVRGAEEVQRIRRGRSPVGTGAGAVSRRSRSL
jgi:hypothetical protein